jgi:hypothetical protein
MTTSSKDHPTARLITQPLPLQNQWTFWHDRFHPNSSTHNYEANLVPLATIVTVQDFWGVYNNIIGPGKLENRQSLHFMKRDIKPMWEDPKNTHGGCWSFKVNKRDTAVVWRELLMLLVGEQLDGVLSAGDEMNGVSVSNRYNADLIQLWNSKAEAAHGVNMMAKLQSVLKGVEFNTPYYKAHREHAHFRN